VTSQVSASQVSDHHGIQALPCYGGEDGTHWVGQVPPDGMGVAVELDHLSAVAQEPAAQEHIGEVNVEQVESKVKNLAHEIL
jgi:hypothetical protein